MRALLSLKWKTLVFWILAFAIVAVVVSGKTPVSNVLPTGNKLVSCDVSVDNKLGSPPTLAGLNCVQRSSCLFTLAPPGLNFLIPKDTVFVKARAADGSESKAEKLEVSEEVFGSSTKTVQLDVCTSSSSGEVRLLSKDSILIKSKPWMVN